MKHFPTHLLALACCATLASAEEKDPFAELVRPTEPLTPEQERRLSLPPGFEIQLVASRARAAQADEHGVGRARPAVGHRVARVSVSRQSRRRRARDSVRIFSDFGPDGRARKMEIFADGLNIPIGLYPFRDRTTAVTGNASPGASRTSGCSRTPTATARRTSARCSTARSAGSATRTAICRPSAAGATAGSTPRTASTTTSTLQGDGRQRADHDAQRQHLPLPPRRLARRAATPAAR